MVCDFDSTDWDGLPKLPELPNELNQLVAVICDPKFPKKWVNSLFALILTAAERDPALRAVLCDCLPRHAWSCRLDALRRHGPCPIHRRSFAPTRLAAQLTCL